MRLFPAIDLYEGQAVRLYKGDYNKKTVYSDQPLAVAKGFRALGARYLHLVDLEGAKNGTTPNFQLITSILRESNLQVEIGGGIRNRETVEQYLNAGAMRVILGTAALENPEFLREMVTEYGPKIAVGVDIKNGFVATHGWLETSQKPCMDFCHELNEMGVRAIICTDISRDGAMKGTNVDLYTQIRTQFPRMELVASGGVSSLEDVRALKENHIPSAILGKAIYEGRLDLNQALRMCPQQEGRP